MQVEIAAPLMVNKSTQTMECHCEENEILDKSFLMEQDCEDDNSISSDAENIEEEVANPHSTSPEISKKYMVFEEQLDLLISTCRSCGKKKQKLSRYENGSCVTYSYTCHCGENFRCDSQPY